MIFIGILVYILREPLVVYLYIANFTISVFSQQLPDERKNQTEQ